MSCGLLHLTMPQNDHIHVSYGGISSPSKTQSELRGLEKCPLWKASHDSRRSCVSSCTAAAWHIKFTISFPDFNGRTSVWWDSAINPPSPTPNSKNRIYLKWCVWPSRLFLSTFWVTGHISSRLSEHWTISPSIQSAFASREWCRSSEQGEEGQCCSIPTQRLTVIYSCVVLGLVSLSQAYKQSRAIQNVKSDAVSAFWRRGQIHCYQHLPHTHTCSRTHTHKHTLHTTPYTHTQTDISPAGEDPIIGRKVK